MMEPLRRQQNYAARRRDRANKKPRRERRGWTRRKCRATIEPDGGAQFPIDRGLGVCPTGAVLLARAVLGTGQNNVKEAEIVTVAKSSGRTRHPLPQAVSIILPSEPNNGQNHPLV